MQAHSENSDSGLVRLQQLQCREGSERSGDTAGEFGGELEGELGGDSGR